MTKGLLVMSITKADGAGFPEFSQRGLQCHSRPLEIAPLPCLWTRPDACMDCEEFPRSLAGRYMVTRCQDRRSVHHGNATLTRPNPDGLPQIGSANFRELRLGEVRVVPGWRHER